MLHIYLRRIHVTVMAKNKTTFRFWLRTDRMNKDGSAPIHLIYQVHGQRKYYGLPGIKILPSNWDEKQQLAVYLSPGKNKKAPKHLSLTSKEVDELNDNLKDLIINIRAIENDFRSRSQPITALEVIEALKQSKEPLTKKIAPTTVIFDFIDHYISEHCQTRVKGSLSVYKSLKAHLGAYQLAKREKVTFQNINFAFFQSFQNFLIGRTKLVAGRRVPMLNNTTIAKQLSTLKTFLNYAKVYGIEVSDNYKQFRIRRQEMEVVALTSDEFENLFSFDLKGNARLAQVRDVFCFACATGLRYSDLEQLSREHISSSEIKLTVKKTKEKLSVPLNPYSRAILERYKDLDRPLPMISNQKLNVYLKELGRLAGIHEPVEIVRFRGAERDANTYPKYELIGVHTGRKTFATLSLEKGMGAEEVMSITGHKDYKSFKRYVNITEKRKKVVMTKAWGGEIKTTKLKAI